MIFREGGWVAEVEPLAAESSAQGLKLELRVVRTLMRPVGISPEAIPEDGGTFTAWKSRDAISAAGWSLEEY
jgi:hypothetical protein